MEFNVGQGHGRNRRGPLGENCYPAVSPDITRAEPPWEGALVDGNLVSASAWTAHPAWLAKFLALPGTRIKP
ncbi:MAG: hypothetical protein ACXWUF_10660 [Methylomagnum sp.]